jgi:hypothetical protein
MKRLLNINILIVFMLFAFQKVNAQECQAGAFEELLKAKLSKGFIHKKTMVLDKSAMPGGSASIKLTFTKGSLYQIHMSNFRGESKGLKIDLYDKSGQLVASNFDAASGRYWPIGYACRFSGEYIIKIYFEGNPQSCGIFVVGERACSFCE